jgi:hypothetical protein
MSMEILMASNLPDVLYGCTVGPLLKFDEGQTNKSGINKTNLKQVLHTKVSTIDSMGS